MISEHLIRGMQSLLLRFGWPTALLQAVVYWLVMTLFVMPPVLTRAEDVSKQRAITRAS